MKTQIVIEIAQVIFIGNRYELSTYLVTPVRHVTFAHRYITSKSMKM